MRRDKDKPSFEVKVARKDHTCFWCGKPILKGTKYFVKPEHDKTLAQLLEKETGYPIYTIKRRTRLWYCDSISWTFCSNKCMSDFFWYREKNQLPEEVKARVDDKITKIIEKVKDVLLMLTALQGTEDRKCLYHE